MITPHVRSDVAPLREVVVGPFKPFTRRRLLLDSPPDMASWRQLRHNRVEVPDQARATRQHEAFVDLLRSHGVTVHTVDVVPDVTIQLYPRDIGVAIDDTFFLTRPRLAVRRREQTGLATLVRGLANVRGLDEGTIEGGDVVVDDDVVLVGLGEETDRAGVASLRRALAEQGSTREVVPIEFSHGGIVHLDTKLTLVAPGTVLWVPDALTLASRVEVERRFDVIEATAEEARALDVNTLALGPDTVMVNARAERIAALLDQRGVTVVGVDYDEVTRFPGGLRCATLPLVRGD